GYRVRMEKVYAHEHGVPQRRKRVVILGNRIGKDFTFPTPAIASHGRIFRKGGVTIAEALSGLPDPSEENRMGLVTDHIILPMDPLQAQRIRALGPGQTMKDLPEHLQHPS